MHCIADAGTLFSGTFMTRHIWCSARIAGAIAGFILTIASLLFGGRTLLAQSPALSLDAIPIPSHGTYAMPLPPMPGDVLTPDERTNTPDIKIGVRAGINRSSYSNDRYLNNVLLDVGDVSGETDVYASASGFGYMIGADLEYPLNQGLSLLLTTEFDRVTFSSNGSVQEPCVGSDGRRQISSSIHDFRARLDFIKLAGSVKLSLSSWYITAGLATAHPFSTSLDRTKRFGGTNCFFPETNNQSVIEEHGEIPSPTRLHYSFRLGWGLIYELSPRLQFSPELTLDFGMGSINKSPSSDLGVYGISATLRYDLR